MTSEPASVQGRERLSALQSRIPWWAGYLLAIVLIAASPFVFTSSFLRLLAEMGIFAIFALGYNILQGYTGIVSFGHAMFFGVAAYTTGKVLLATESFLLAIAASVFVVLVLAVTVGYLGIKRIGVYFAMITLAFNQLFYIVAEKLEFTGGSNGLIGIPTPAPLGLNLSDIGMTFYFVSALLLLSYVSIKRLVRSPFGLSLIAIRENEERTQALGYHVRKVKIYSLTLSALFAAIAGVLFVVLTSTVTPVAVLHFTNSGEVIFMILLGGQGTLLGPIIGAFSLIFMEDMLSGILTRWQLLLGLLFVLLSVGFRRGIIGAVSDLWQYVVEDD